MPAVHIGLANPASNITFTYFHDCHCGVHLETPLKRRVGFRLTVSASQAHIKKTRPKQRMQTITSNWKLADIYIHPTNPFNVICSICSFNLSQGFGFVPCWNASILLWQRGTTLWKRSEGFFYHGRLGSPRAQPGPAWSTHRDTVSTELGATRNVKPKTSNFFGMVYTNYSVFSLLSLCIRFKTLVQSCPI